MTNSDFLSFFNQKKRS